MRLINLHDLAVDEARLSAMTTSPPRNLAATDTKFVIARHRNFMDRHIALRRLYAKLRGDSRGKNRRMYPKTTNGDVLQLATLWTKELMKVMPRNGEDQAEHQRWADCLKAVGQHADAKKPNVTYGKNEAFWVCSARVAIYLESRRASPSRWELFKESVVEAVAELPGTIGRATGAAAEAATDVAGSAADFVRKPARAALVVLGGALLLPPIIRAVRK